VQDYGVIVKSGKTPITPSTLFQAAFICKAMTTVGPLRPVEKGLLAF
jgi:CubicO group peptidase (beta-lactamase class C family)